MFSDESTNFPVEDTNFPDFPAESRFATSRANPPDMALHAKTSREIAGNRVALSNASEGETIRVSSFFFK